MIDFSTVALRKESVDRNTNFNPASLFDLPGSLSARRAWIEITTLTFPGFGVKVALRKESVDRNLVWHCMREDVSVALRKESVDRNPISFGSLAGPSGVALRKESVDRNKQLID